MWTISPTASRSALDMYLEQEAPFSGGKKHKEFPDAYVISTISEYVSHGDRSIYICTNDNGFTEACATIKGVTTLKSLKDLLGHVAKRKEAHYALLLAEVNKVTELVKVDLEKGIREDVKDISFNIADYHAEVEDAEAGAIEFHGDLSIIYVAKSELSAQFSFDVDYTVSVSGRQVVHDPVDKDDVDIGSKSVPPKTGTISGTVSLTFDRHDDSISLVDFEIDLPRDVEIEVEDDEWEYDR